MNTTRMFAFATAVLITVGGLQLNLSRPTLVVGRVQI